MTGYVCKYTPVELIGAFGEEARFIRPPAQADGARARIHPNVCGYAKAVLAGCGETMPGRMVFTDCCDALKRAADVLGRDGQARCFRLGLPRAADKEAAALYAGELKKLARWMGQETGKRFDAGLFHEALKQRREDGQGDYIALMGARAPQELLEFCAQTCGLPVVDKTCAQLERNFGTPPQTDDADALVDWYAARLLELTPCMRMRDVAGRDALVADPRMKGIIYHTIKFCDFYGFEYAGLETKIPILKLETDYTQLPEGQIKTRLEAFMENNGFAKRAKATPATAGRYFVGVDSGSTSTNVVILDEDAQLVGSHVAPTGAKAAESAARALEEALRNCGIKRADAARVVATGYGRQAAASDGQVTEITCHAKGAHFLFPQARTLIDIGGQDSKIVRLDAAGNVKDFSMNDKCAAGTGRFLELMAQTLELPLERFARLGMEWKEDIPISSMCAVFAESEVISLIARDKEVADIIHGLNAAIAGRVYGMVARLSCEGPYVMTGGVAMNEGVRAAIAQKVGEEALCPPRPQLVGALGAALLAREQNNAARV